MAKKPRSRAMESFRESARQIAERRPLRATSARVALPSRQSAEAQPETPRDAEQHAQVQQSPQEAIAPQPVEGGQPATQGQNNGAPQAAAVFELSHPKSLEEFTKIIEAAVLEAGQQLWYRGTSSEDYELSPSLYRHPTKTTAAELLEVERETLDWFRRRSVPYVRLPGLDQDLDYMFLMQHHGAPTRLLDWSENPFIALFFALTSERRGKKKDGAPLSERPCIWLLSPIDWNKHTLNHQGHPGTPLSARDDVVEGYLKNKQVANVPIYPVALFGTHNSQRIVSQRGVFCLFGKDTHPMESIAVDGKYPAKVLRKIIIEKQDVEPLTKSLVRLGFSDAMMFPDLDGLARELKRSFAF